MDALDPALFIGSSSEGEAIARALQVDVDKRCEPTVWSQDVFQVGGMPLSELLRTASNTDFAALVLTPDDSIVSRGKERPAARDNVIFELGLFLGALGSQRVFIIRPRKQLPPCLAIWPESRFSTTTLIVMTVILEQLLAQLLPPSSTTENEGLRSDRRLISQPVTTFSASRRGLTIDEEQRELNRELDAIEKSAKAQGWTVRTRSDTAFRLVARNGNRYSFPVGSAAETRDRLRSFSQQLADAGLRLTQTVLQPVTEEPE